MSHNLEGRGISELPRGFAGREANLDAGCSGTLRGVPGFRQHHGCFAAAPSNPPHTRTRAGCCSERAFMRTFNILTAPAGRRLAVAHIFKR